jgi:hypothetical protein
MKKSVKTKDLVEDLEIYKQVQWLVSYSTNALVKFPKKEKFRGGVAYVIAEETYGCMRSAIEIGVRKEKFDSLSDLDIRLKYLKAIVRIAFTKRYISEKNLEVWITKLTDINNIVVGWRKKWEKP